MQLSNVKTIALRPQVRLTKMIAASMMYWQMWRNKLPLPDFTMAAEKDQPVGPEVYNLDSHGNGYRDRDLAGEAEVVLDDFTEIEVSPELDCLAELVMDHNVRDTQQRGQRSTRNILNRYPGSLGFMSGSAWEIVDQISAYKWKEIIYGQTAQEVVRGRLTEDDFLRLCLHVIFIYVEAEKYRREGTVQDWETGEKESVIQNLLNTEFQGKCIREGLGHPLTLATYIRDLYQVGFTLQEISDLLAPWMSIWLHLERSLDEAPKLEPCQRFNVGNGKENGVVFDFVSVNGKPVKGHDNPLVHQGWLSDDNTGRPRANCVIVRMETGHTAIFCRGVEESSIRELAYGLMERENGIWTYESGWVIFNGSKSRPDQKKTGLPLVRIAGGCQATLRLVPRRPFPANKYAPRPHAAAR